MYALLYGPLDAWVGRVKVSDARPYPPLIRVCPADGYAAERLFAPRPGGDEVDKFYELAPGDVVVTTAAGIEA